jgi:hypothetical protein
MKYFLLAANMALLHPHLELGSILFQQFFSYRQPFLLYHVVKIGSSL